MHFYFPDGTSNSTALTLLPLLLVPLYFVVHCVRFFLSVVRRSFPSRWNVQLSAVGLNLKSPSWSRHLAAYWSQQSHLRKFLQPFKVNSRSTTRFLKEAQCLTITVVFHWSWLGFTTVRWVSLDFTRAHWSLLSFTGVYWVSLEFTGFY